MSEKRPQSEPSSSEASNPDPPGAAERSHETRKKKRREKSVIGWREIVDLPEWGIEGILGKADTGARSSAIDVSHVEVLPSGIVRFDVAALRGEEEIHTRVEAPIRRRTRVKSSLGDRHHRIFVETLVVVAGRTFRTELGLVDRQEMICRMLLGRRSLAKLFLVDSGRTYIHGRRHTQATIEEEAPQ